MTAPMELSHRTAEALRKTSSRASNKASSKEEVSGEKMAGEGTLAGASAVPVHNHSSFSYDQSHQEAGKVAGGLTSE